MATAPSDCPRNGTTAPTTDAATRRIAATCKRMALRSIGRDLACREPSGRGPAANRPCQHVHFRVAARQRELHGTFRAPRTERDRAKEQGLVTGSRQGTAGPHRGVRNQDEHVERRFDAPAWNEVA